MMAEMNTDQLRVNRQPKSEDPLEISIRQKLEDLLVTDWARSTIGELREIQSDFLGSALRNSDNPESILRSYRKLLPQLTRKLNTEIAGGQNYLRELQGKKGIIVIVNHLGTAKLTRIPTETFGLDIDLKEIEPFPVRHAPISKISESLGFRLFETAIELPPPFLEIQKACKVITVSPDGKGRTKRLVEDVRRVIDGKPNSVIVMYPEGGTSGKRNAGSVYDLDHFHSGAFVVAQELGFPVLPVCQYLNPEKGLELHLLEPFYIQNGDLAKVSEITQKTKVDMQTKLDSLFLQSK